MNSLKYSLALFLLPALLGAGPLRLDDDHDDEDRGRKLASSSLIRTAELSPDSASIIPLPWGSDSLESGSIEVRSRRILHLRLDGAPANQTYNVLVCGLTTLSNRCTTLGQVATSSEGSIRETLEFPAALNTFAAFLALTRGGMTHYVSGFSLPAVPPVSNGAEVTVKGKLLSKNVPNNIFNIQGFNPVIYIDAETRLKGFDGLAELDLGTEVEVEGVTRTDGNVQAREIKVRKEKD